MTEPKSSLTDLSGTHTVSVAVLTTPSLIGATIKKAVTSTDSVPKWVNVSGSLK